jgi:hypothetical protein
MNMMQRLGLATQVMPIAQTLPSTLDGRVQRAIVRAAMDVAAVVEEPLGSNRGPMIDAYLRNAHVPDAVILAGKGYWCAAAVGQWWEDAGLPTPSGRASCDRWMTWAKETRRWSTTPVLGAAVLYGVPGDARHIGLVVRLAPLVLSIEGNTTIESGFDRNGNAVALKIVDPRTDPILGYCLPLPAPPTT